MDTNNKTIRFARAGLAAINDMQPQVSEGDWEHSATGQLAWLLSQGDKFKPITDYILQLEKYCQPATVSADATEFVRGLYMKGLVPLSTVDVVEREVQAYRDACRLDGARMREALEELRGELCRTEAPTSHKALFRRLHAIVNDALSPETVCKGI